MKQELIQELSQKDHQSQLFSKNVQQFKKFLQNNSQYVLSKFSNFFQSQNKCLYTIVNIPQQNILSFINEVFSLQSYTDNILIKKAIQNGIKTNFQQYKFEKIAQQKKQEMFDFQKGKQLLIYIIQNNSMFAVQYDSGQNKHQFAAQNHSNMPHNLKIQVNLSQIQDNYDNRNSQTLKDNNKSTFQVSRAQEYKIKNAFLSNQNEFDNYEASNNQNQNLINKNAKIMFQFYCKQQMELPNLSTFDYIKNQTQSMSLGKCLTFAKATQLFNVFIKKQALIAKFKKVSEGKKYINFQKFLILLNNLQILDPQLKNRLGLFSEDPHKFLKYLKLPFHTKDIHPRQIIAYRNFTNKLTQHSGKTSQNLKEQIQTHKAIVKKLWKINQIKNESQGKTFQSHLISPKDLTQKYKKQKKNGKDFTVDLSFISSIVHPQENDKTWLKQHEISTLVKKNSQQFREKRLETERYKSVDKLTIRKQYIMDDIRKRIKEIQSVQKMDYASLKKKTRSFRNIDESQQKKKDSLINKNLRYYRQ